MDKMNLQLIQPIKEKEIQEVLFSIHPNKASGPDGIFDLFFQRFCILFVLI